MKLTEELLLKWGFEKQDSFLPTYIFAKKGKNCIKIESQYFNGTNILGYGVFAWNTDEYGRINKRTQTSVIDTVEDFEKCLELVGLNNLIEY